MLLMKVSTSSTEVSGSAFDTLIFLRGAATEKTIEVPVPVISFDVLSTLGAGTSGDTSETGSGSATVGVADFGLGFFTAALLFAGRRPVGLDLVDMPPEPMAGAVGSFDVTGVFCVDVEATVAA